MIRPLQRIVAQRYRNDCTDRMLYDMIDEIASKYFYTGLVVGIVAGVLVAALIKAI